VAGSPDVGRTEVRDCQTARKRHARSDWLERLL
jgi:hypothetical protein